MPDRGRCWMRYRRQQQPAQRGPASCEQAPSRAPLPVRDPVDALSYQKAPGAAAAGRRELQMTLAGRHAGIGAVAESRPSAPFRREVV
ncbi:MAG: hypothetical protein M1821_001560 [Bathelium mastoideum]|nr:MAG: hypothetical protein M1821_001560 [Bathelium mastoideum]